jgi:hypothetical protein
LEDHGMENVVIYLDLWNILRPLGIYHGIYLFYSYLIYFTQLWYIATRKIWQPGSDTCCHPKILFGLWKKSCHPFRVTRFGKLSPIGWLFNLGSFFSKLQK